MLDGVEWAAAEIVFYMLLATLIGFAIAYVFIRWFQKDSIAETYEAELAAQEELARKAEYRLTESNKTLDKLQLELKGESERVGVLEAQLDSARASLEAIEESGTAPADVARLHADLESCGAERAKLAARITEVEQELALRDARIAELEAGISAEPQVASSSAVSAPASLEPTKDEGLARISEIAQRTAGGVPVADDDLKRVHGIGPKLERTLKDLGISSFRQIANFEQEDIAYVTAALDAFRGRIERDDWMGSAAEQHAMKYNEPV